MKLPLLMTMTGIALTTGFTSLRAQETKAKMGETKTTIVDSPMVFELKQDTVLLNSISEDIDAHIKNIAFMTEMHEGMKSEPKISAQDLEEHKAKLDKMKTANGFGVSVHNRMENPLVTHEELVFGTKKMVFITDFLAREQENGNNDASIDELKEHVGQLLSKAKTAKPKKDPFIKRI